MKLRLAIAGAAIAAVALVGCAAAEPETPVERTTPAETAEPTTSPSATPEPSGPPPLSCNTIVTEHTLAGFEVEGMVHEVDYESEVRAEGSVEELFFDFGGLVCKWSLPVSDVWFTAAYSEITETQASEAQALLEAEGFIRTDNGGDVTFAIAPGVDSMGHNDTYVFESGAWYHSSDPNGIDEIRAVIAERG